jgi:2-haloacid dehalogenase
MPPQAVLWDLGGVLVDWNPRHLYRRVFAQEAEMERFLGGVCTQSWNEEQDAGRPFAEGVRLLVAQYPHYAVEIEAYWRRWGEMISGEIPGSVAVLGQLRERGVPLFGLTNWSAETFPIAAARFAFLEWFSGILVSGAERLKKPDARFFALAVTRFGLEPARTLFIDDSPRNVAAARELGFHTHHFIDAAGLRAALVEHALLPG